MKKHKGLDELRRKTPADVKIRIDYSYATAKRINEILTNKKLTRRKFAALLQKKESEISKWMTGAHNFTYATISKIEAVLGEKILDLHYTPKVFLFQFDSGESSITVSVEGEFKPGHKPKQCLPMTGNFELTGANN
jgi:transcriptional regulator with XRE-family HTH domain